MVFARLRTPRLSIHRDHVPVWQWAMAAVTSLAALIAVGALMWYVRTAPQVGDRDPAVVRDV